MTLSTLKQRTAAAPSEAGIRGPGLGGLHLLAQHGPQDRPRRIDDEHRLVYIVTEAEIVILAARYHY
jgi:toxin YoeB